tara:strand:- start:31211 stop:31408 length:198 start_codon:yes stop_codon:yes gene_type:complete
MNIYGRINTQEIKAACDRFLESRGERKVTYREQMDLHAQRGSKRRPRKSKMDKVAEEIEDDSRSD